ncbi:hypothetical protein RchiOBHm_Chr4g0393841 [Rosa chinensis]|uniref:Uncharacterized protein n=1 Tax=Rosa chinensis TaxID=74649 RepID=A0A2P6QR60_ROSCH|nr:hypothetical protein RchiOBHm_Chr4g0393841 [Rosa chinensis]
MLCLHELEKLTISTLIKRRASIFVSRLKLNLKNNGQMVRWKNG